MRVSTLAQKLLGVTGLVVQKVTVEGRNVVIDVRPRWRNPRCGECRVPRPGYDRREVRLWRHLSFGVFRLWLRYAPRRVDCPQCGVVGEQVPWAARGSRFTEAFEELAAYLAQITDKTTVTKLLGITWRSVGAIVNRVVERRLAASRFDDLRFIGIDEFSYRKRHRYVTVVVDHAEGRIVWARKGRSAETLAAFFKELGEAGRAKILAVTMDMAGGYLKAVQDLLPEAVVVFDRFHAQRLVGDAVDEVRREEVRRLEGADEVKFIKKSRYALLRNPWNMTKRDSERLSVIQKKNARLYRAYLLKESFARALDYKQPKRARDALDEWLAWASRSKLKPFVKVARTVRKYAEGILAYVACRLTNGLVEGTNNRLRMIARRAYGFHSAAALIAMMFLCCGGITLEPPLP